jgi:hypothetical protein
MKIKLDVRLPEALDDEATAATATDWTTIQKAGETKMRKIRPLAAVPELPASKVTSGEFATARIPNLDAGKVTSGAFHVDRIPALPASKTTSGAFDAARIPNLDATKITSGTFNEARIPNLSAAKITSGTFDLARIPSVSSVWHVEGAYRSLSNSYVTCASLSVTSTAASDVLLILADAEASAWRPAGTSGAAAVLMRVTLGGVDITGDMYIAYVDGGAGSITIPKGAIGADYPLAAQTYQVNLQGMGIGGGRTLALRVSGITGTASVALQCKRDGFTTSGHFQNGRIAVLRMAK